MIRKNEVKEIILRTLFSSSNKRLDSFSVFKRTMIPFSVFSKNLGELVKTGHINVDGFLVELSQIGFEYVATNPKILENKNKEWRNVPQKMLGPKLEVDYKYVPSIRLLNKKLKKTIDNE